MERDSLILQLRSATTENLPGGDLGQHPTLSPSYGVAAPLGFSGGSQPLHSSLSENVSSPTSRYDVDREAEHEFLRQAVKRLVAEKQSLLEHIRRSSTSTASLSTLLSESQQRHEHLIARANHAVKRAESMSEEVGRLRAAHALQMGHLEEMSNRNEELLTRTDELERRLREAAAELEHARRDADEEAERERREREILRREAERKAEDAERAAGKIRKLQAEMETLEDGIRMARNVVEAAISAVSLETELEQKREIRRHKLPSPNSGCAALLEDLMASAADLADRLRILSANLRDREADCRQSTFVGQELREEILKWKQVAADAEMRGREEKERAIQEEREIANKRVQEVRDGIEEKVRVLTAEYDALQARFRKLSQATRIAEKAKQELRSFDLRMKGEEKKHREREEQLIAERDKKFKEAVDELKIRHAQDILALKRDIESARARFRLVRNENVRLRREMEDLAGVLRDGGKPTGITGHATLETTQVVQDAIPAELPVKVRKSTADLGIGDWMYGVDTRPDKPMTSNAGNERSQRCQPRSRPLPWRDDGELALSFADECDRTPPELEPSRRKPELPADGEAGLRRGSPRREKTENSSLRRCSARSQWRSLRSPPLVAPERAVGKLKSIREQLRDLRSSLPRN